MELNVSQLLGSRFELALQLFQQGQSITCDGVVLRLLPDALQVCAVSSWQMQNVTEQTAWQDIRAAQHCVEKLIHRNSDFAILIEGKPKRYLLIEDYGMGSVELWRVANGSLVWSKRLPKA